MSKGLSIAGAESIPGITLSVADTGNNLVLVCVCLDSMAGLSAIAEHLKTKPGFFISSMAFNAVNVPSSIATPQPVQATMITVICEIRPVYDGLRGIAEGIADLRSSVDEVRDSVAGISS
jgi:hypothetical protein